MEYLITWTPLPRATAIRGALVLFSSCLVPFLHLGVINHVPASLQINSSKLHDFYFELALCYVLSVLVTEYRIKWTRLPTAVPHFGLFMDSYIERCYKIGAWMLRHSFSFFLSVSGRAYTGAVCTMYRVGLGEDIPGFYTGGHTTTHEMAHM